MIDELNPFQKKIVYTALTGAKTNLEVGGSIMPIAFVVNSKTQKIDIVGCHFSSQSAKEQFREFLGLRIREKGVDTVVLCLESWYVEAKNPEEVAEVCRVGASNHPRRKEAVMVVVESRQGAWTAKIPIDRTGSMPSIDIDRAKFEVSRQSMGLFSNFIAVKAAPKPIVNEGESHD